MGKGLETLNRSMEQPLKTIQFSLHVSLIALKLRPYDSAVGAEQVINQRLPTDKRSNYRGNCGQVGDGSADS